MALSQRRGKTPTNSLAAPTRTSPLSGLYGLVSPIADYLFSFELISTIVLINANTINLDLPDHKATNSTLLVGPKGHGKTTLLYHIIRQNNPKVCPKLPSKPYESQLVKMAPANFDNKTWVFDDLIVVFRGTASKQREQLTGFFTDFLTTGEYSREHHSVKGRIVCIFGMATSGFNKYGKKLFVDTFQDRFIPVRFKFDDRLDRELLQAQRNNHGKALPKITLPKKKTRVQVVIPSTFFQEIDDRAAILSEKDVMSIARAQTYIENFLRSCADLNSRTRVTDDDIRVLRLTWPLYFGVNLGSVKMRVCRLILRESLKGYKVSGAQIKQTMNLLGFSTSAVQKTLSDLRNEKVVQFHTVSGKGGGYDYLYWV